MKKANNGELFSNSGLTNQQLTWVHFYLTVDESWKMVFWEVLKNICLFKLLNKYSLYIHEKIYYCEEPSHYGDNGETLARDSQW
jgi:hypothetical protein